jgi:hypothetical protein
MRLVVVIDMGCSCSVFPQVQDEPMWSQKPRIQTQVVKQHPVLESIHRQHSIWCLIGQSTAKPQHLQANSYVEGVDGTVHRHHSVPRADASPTSMSADSSTSWSHRSNSCVKQLQHHATIVENEVDGWRLWSTEHRALTDGVSDRREMDISSLAASITTARTHTIVLCV